MKQISDDSLYDSPLSEPPNLNNWFSSYVYESPMLDTSDDLGLFVFGKDECIEETIIEKEITNFESTIDVDEDLDQLIVDESDIEEGKENTTSLFRFTKKEKAVYLAMVNSKDYKEKLAAHKEKAAYLAMANSNDYKEKLAAHKNGTTTITDETEVIFLRNRVKCLEDEVRKLNDTINRLVSSNTDYRRD
ncbi:uncharacterized protein LOC9321921 isoform X1 [Arabidopsis lyrata subsp. lyrata]|uniref:uncharacterized protein LOC9301548 isoform X1 n=1 Tax=Arabidopsis lyrata subsp. lyrata TaxID=81972 RepID=UPI000A29B836|nr:uncharacterized protein LOC9301548 isoform X1 [Arabidopsis lyrata subsp. lyrata]XP_020871245.1 uncharacterized protein LOC9301548 isoform X1 [Arabidopsis lyrata subsp. lyrata]XP_020888778.1 uncharacterized protein LOC9321921 isoform X1 [Arabidopsis lyrata subsp. lyrata]|eukprot:XP_020871244.1 uncharacterized protein LOC9301548 isoform X1 [Arabidopsis lyrata subsp. lyrata]